MAFLGNSQEKFERIASTRRRQKEQHKRFLAALKEKRVQEEEERLLRERKEAEKRCNVKMWAERRLQKAQKSTGFSEDHEVAGENTFRGIANGGGSGVGGAEGGPGGASTPAATAVVVTWEGGGEGAAVAPAGGVAGSGLNAIRKARSRSGEPEDRGGSIANPGEACFLSAPGGDAEEEAARLDRGERRRRSLELRLAKEKARRHLESLTLKKRERDDEEENEKRRQLRRMQLLKAKVMVMAKELRENRMAEAYSQKAEADSKEDGTSGGTVNARARLTDEELQVSVERLTQQRKGAGAITTSARDFNDWKRKHGVSPDTKVFVMTGWYPCVKKALVERGWMQNPDRDSPFFDLKWTLHSQDIRTTDIQPWQLCNHFFKNVAITTKAGLLGNLRNLKWFADCDCDEVLPRGYDLSVDIEAFLDDYCATAAESLLKHVLLRAKGRKAIRRLSDFSSGRSDYDQRRPPEKKASPNLTVIDDDCYDSDDDDFDDFDDSDVEDQEEQEEEQERLPPSSSTSPIHVISSTISHAGVVAATTSNVGLSSSSSIAAATESSRRAEIEDATRETAEKGVASRETSPALPTETLPTTDAAADLLTTPTVPATIVAEMAETTTAQVGGVPTSSGMTVGDAHQTLASVAPSHCDGEEGTAMETTEEDKDRKSRSRRYQVVVDVINKEGASGKASGGGGGGGGGGGDGGGKGRKRAVPVSARRRRWEPEGAEFEVNAEILKAALAVCRRRH
ncbi:unnamed protein product, partial [Laminaria digitata]